MRGHFQYIRFKTFSMTLGTPQCEVFWALLSNSKHLGVPEDSKSPTLGVLGFTPTLGPKWGCNIHSLIFFMMYVSLTYTFIEFIVAKTFIFIGKLNAYFGRRLIHKCYLHVFKTYLTCQT
jgi:hypothetical protein